MSLFSRIVGTPEERQRRRVDAEAAQARRFDGLPEIIESFGRGNRVFVSRFQFKPVSPAFDRIDRRER